MSDVLNEERLTWAQICERHPMQWVVLAKVHWAGLVRGQRVISGLLLSHGSEEESWERAKGHLEIFHELVHTQAHPIRSDEDYPKPVECPCPDW